MTDYEQKPFGDAAFAENPENRCPVILLLDTSFSMKGVKMEQLNEGLQTFQRELADDSLAAKRVEVAVVGFGPVTSHVDFTEAQYFRAPWLEADGGTPTGAAIAEAVRMLEDRKKVYRANGVSYYRPWLFLITDGDATDSTVFAEQLIREGMERKSFSFYPVAVEGADVGKLAKLGGATPLKLKDVSFKELFVWLSASLSKISKSTPGDAVPLDNPTTPSGWATAG